MSTRLSVQGGIPECPRPFFPPTGPESDAAKPPAMVAGKSQTLFRRLPPFPSLRQLLLSPWLCVAACCWPQRASRFFRSIANSTPVASEGSAEGLSQPSLGRAPALPWRRSHAATTCGLPFTFILFFSNVPVVLFLSAAARFGAIAATLPGSLVDVFPAARNFFFFFFFFSASSRCNGAVGITMAHCENGVTRQS